MIKAKCRELAPSTTILYTSIHLHI